MEERMMDVTFETAHEECVKRYLERGYSLEKALEIAPHTEEKVFFLYDVIQKEKIIAKKIKIEDVEFEGLHLKHTVLIENDTPDE